MDNQVNRNQRMFGNRNIFHMNKRVGILAIIVLCVGFCCLFTSQATAEEGDTIRIRGYEQVLIRPGDTLDSLAHTSASRYFRGSVSEYKEQIVRLNNLSSDYIREGVYLMMPISRPLPES